MRSSCRPQSELRPPLMGLAPPYGFATHCSGHCTTCAAQGIKGPCWFGVILIFLRIIYGSPLWQLKHRARVAQVSPFKGASQDTCWQQPCSTWASVLVGSPAFRRGFTSLSSPGKVPRLLSNWATWSTACVSPRLFLWVLALRPYFPGGTLNALASPPEGSTLRAVSVHRLGRGLKGYLILVDAHAFVPQRQGHPSWMPSLLVFRQISTDFTPTPAVPSASNALYPDSLWCLPQVKPEVFYTKLIKPPTDPLRPINPDNAWDLCITAAAGLLTQ